LDDLVGKLLTHGIHLQEENDDQVLKQGVALKSTNKDFEMESEVSSDDDEEPTDMIAKSFVKIFWRHPNFKGFWKCPLEREMIKTPKVKIPLKLTLTWVLIMAMDF